MLNLRQNLSNSSLSLRRFSVERVTPELIEKAVTEGDPRAMELLASNILKLVHGAMVHLGITGSVEYGEWTDFRDKTVLHILEYSLSRYDATKGTFSNFVYNHVRNQWFSYLKGKQRRPTEITEVGEEGASVFDVLADPRSLDFVGDLRARTMLDNLLSQIEKPRDRDILALWVDSDASDTTERSREIAGKINEKYPQRQITPYRVYRIIRDVVRPLVLKTWPESKPFERREIKEEVVEKEKPLEEVEVEEKEYLPRGPSEPAPIYRIDPETGERTLIGLDLRRRISAREDTWFDTLISFFKLYA